MAIKSVLFYTKSDRKTVLIATRNPSSKNYIQAVSSAGFIPQTLDSWFANKQNYNYSSLSSLQYDYLLLPGGGDIDPGHYKQEMTQSNPPDQTLDLTQFLLLQDAISKNIPVIGICKGMQLINIFFGGDLLQDFSSSNLHRYTTQDQMHSVYTIKDLESEFINTDLFQFLSGITTVNSAHHQCINHLGKNLDCVQYSDDNIPETIVHQSLPVVGLQWHPERLPSLTPNMFRRLLLCISC